MVSARSTSLPGEPVNTSATKNGCDRKRSILRARDTASLVLFRQFIHAQNGDDVLQRLVALQNLLHLTRDRVMLFADDQRRQHARGRVERVHRRIDALGGDVARQHGGRIQMRERGRRRRIGQVVGRHVNRLHRGDRTLGRGGDAFLQRAHVGRERRLITHRRRNTAEQRRHFRAGLREAEDVVDEEQHVLALVAEIFRQRQTGEADAGAGARRLVHLAEHQRALGAFGRPAVRVLVDAGFDELVIKVVAFAGTLADAGEHRIAAVRFGDVVDQFLNQHGLADAGAAEQADLAALGVRRQQIDDLDAGDQNLRFGRLLGVFRRLGVDRAALVGLHRTGLVDRLADDVDDAAEQAGADRHRDRDAGVGDGLAAHQTLGDVHRDRAHGRFAEMLGDFEHQPVVAVLGFERVQDRRQIAFELHVDDGADDLGDLAGCVLRCGHIVLVT